MKKTKVITLILLGLIISNLSAQDDSRKFRLGLQFSPNLSWLSPGTNGYEKNGTKFGFSYGLSTEFFLGKNYLFSTGFDVASLGGKLRYQGTYKNSSGIHLPTEVAQSFAIKYIEIPLSLKLRTNEIGYMTYYGNFGFKTGINYKTTSDFSYKDINSGISSDKVNTKSDMFFINTYLVIGAGVEYNISGNTNLMIGFTFNNGFINQLDTKVNEIDPSTNKAAIDKTGNPILTNKKASANLNYFSLDIGIYF